MLSPLFLIIIGILFLLLFLTLIWPNKGIVYRLKRYDTDKRRVLIEDALKYIYHNQDRAEGPEVKSMSKYLNTGEERALRLVNELKEMKLVQTGIEKIRLTPEGQAYALKIIRFHRLWEKYLSEKTGLNELEWHDDAEYREHLLTSNEADELAADMGNPLVDPHGDPIPDSEGKIMKSRGVQLREINEGEFARIVHIEDEPPEVYSQLVAEGLYPGMKIRLIEKNSERIRFEANGEECMLAPVVASNLSVDRIDKPGYIIENYKSLSALEPGEEGRILGISKLCRGQQRRRLLDFGFVPGSKISAELVGSGGEPVAYKIRGTTVAIRKDQADLIFIEK